MARNNRADELQESLKFFKVGDVYQEFAPWQRNDKGRHHYVKLSKGEEKAFLFVGADSGLRSEVQQAMMRLVNDGWSVAGEVEVVFDGRSEPGVDPYVFQDPLVLELGKGLLAMADPQHSEQLMQELETARDLIARQMGFVLPSIKIVDNLHIDPQHYLLRVKGNVAAQGELFLDRYFVMAPLELLANLEGWITTDPVHRMPAKWVESTHRDKAESLGCLVLGPLAVLMTHLRFHLVGACGELLGLQEGFDLISRLKTSHPIVVEDFLSDRTNLRQVRKILKRLLAEKVPIRDLVTILETCGDHLDRLGDDDFVTRQCRQKLSREICSFYLNQEGVLRGMVLGPLSEQKMVEAHVSPAGIQDATMDQFTHSLKKVWDTHSNPAVLFTSPAVRSLVQEALSPYFPDLGILSRDEINRSYRVEICGTVEPLVETPTSDLI